MLYPVVYLRPALDIPISHHERWDGSGYPKGLKGEEIPLAARIFTVVDVWDALCSDRPYRKGSDHKDVINYLKDHSGIFFDPKIVEVFIDLLEKGEFGDKINGNQY
jgi:HD-GYP domain-containing protein (c-di-GMP phosphodiesterase class II)